MDEARVLVPAGIIGYSYNRTIFETALQRPPDAIAVDGGSIDPGPYYLGSGVSFLPRLSIEKDLEPMLIGGKRLGIPVIITSVFGNGARPHLEWGLRIVEELAFRHGLELRVALVFADIDKDFLKRKVAAGKIQPLGHKNTLTPEVLDRTTAVVGQMGHEPIVRALDAGVDVVLAGRACDEGAISAYPIWKGFDVGLASHMGKIVECGSRAIVRYQGQRTPVWAICRKNHFLIEPADPQSQATVESVCTHMLYEERDPLYIEVPGGAIDARQSTFEPMNERIVAVRGSRFVEYPAYTVKLEGAAPVGYRCVIVGGTRSSAMIANIDHCLQTASDMVRAYFGDVPEADYQIHFHVYGRNGVMGQWEPEPSAVAHELGIVTEVVAKNQDLADAICHYASGTALHHMDYPGNLSKGAGNIAYMTSPLEIGQGRAYELSIYHTVEVDDPCELFPMDVITVGKRAPTLVHG